MALGNVISVYNLSFQSLEDDQSGFFLSLIKHYFSDSQGKKALQLHCDENVCRTAVALSVVMINVFYDCCFGHKI